MSTVLHYYNFQDNTSQTKVAQSGRSFMINDMIEIIGDIIEEKYGKYGRDNAISIYKRGKLKNEIKNDPNFPNGIFFIKKTDSKFIIYEKRTEFINKGWLIDNFVPFSNIKKIGLVNLMDISVSNFPQGKNSIQVLDCSNFNIHGIKNANFDQIEELLNITDIRIIKFFKNLKKITFHKIFNNEIKIDDFGESYTKIIFLQFGQYTGNTYESLYNHKFAENILPPNLTHLIVGSNYNKIFDRGVLPKNLKYLKLGECYDQEFGYGVLPQSLETFICGCSFTQEFKPSILPQHLNKIRLGNYIAKVHIGTFPDSLRKCIIKNGFNQPIKDIFPENLEYLDVGNSFDHMLLPNELPPNLKKFKIGDKYNFPIDKYVLNEGLIELKIGNNFNHLIRNEILPTSLRSIKLGLAYDKNVELYNTNIKICILPNFFNIL